MNHNKFNQGIWTWLLHLVLILASNSSIHQAVVADPTAVEAEEAEVESSLSQPLGTGQGEPSR